MNAKIYSIGKTIEARIANKVYTSVEGESRKDFIKRLEGLLETDFDEAVNIVEVTKKSLEKYDDTKITEAYRASKGGLQEQMLLEILNDRGIEVEKIEKTVRVKIEKRDIEEVKKSPEYLAAKANVGKLATFTPNVKEGETAEEVTGTVKSISLNKTNTIIYYNIKSVDKLRCCTSKNETLEFFDF